MKTLLMKTFLSRLFNQHRLWMILLIGLINGCLFCFAVPAWWHYDEPGQFEYAWLMANDPLSLQNETINSDIRRNIALSLDEYGWYDVRNYRPNFQSSEPMWIGTPQTGDKITVGYYFLLSLPLRFFSGTSIIFQYQLCRFISLLFFLMTLYLAGKIAESIFAVDSPLRWMVPLFLAALPGFVDMMLAVSNDVAAVFSFSLFLFASVRLLRRKINLVTIIVFIVSLVFCGYAKNVTWFALILAPFVVMFCLIPKSSYKPLIAALGAIFIILGLLSMDLGGATDWFIQTSAGTQGRERVPNAPHGDYALVERVTPAIMNGLLGQCITPNAFRAVQGQKISYGAWIWADSVLQINSPTLRFFDGRTYVDSDRSVISVGATPKFYAFVSEVPEQATRACAFISSQGLDLKDNQIFYDGFVLADGGFSNTPPEFAAEGPSIVWDGAQVTNLIRNNSFEQGGVRIRPWVEKLARKIPIVSGRLSFTLSTLFSPHSFGWFYKNSAVMMFRTFWADIAGNKVILPGRYTYPIIFVVFVMGILGAVLFLWRNASKINRDAGLLFTSSIILIMGANLVQGTAPLLESDAMSSFARHNYPVIIPVAAILCTGWRELLRRFGRFLALDDIMGAALFLTFFYGILIASLLSCLSYFHPALLDGSLLVALLISLLGLYRIIFWIIEKSRSKIDK